MKKIEHIGIAVSDLNEAEAVYETLLGKHPYKREIVESEGVETSFFEIGESKIELLSATDPSSPIAKFIEKRGAGMHHIAFAVDDIEVAIQALKEKGFRLLNDTAKRGADKKLVAFLHPKSAGGVLVELCQEITG